MNQGAIQLDIEEKMLQFLKICKSLFDYRFEKLVVQEGFLDVPILDGITIKEFWNRNSKSDIARRLKSFMENIVIFHYNVSHNDEIKKLEDVTCEGVSSSLLCEAYQAKAPAISFDTSVVFHSDFLNIKHHFIENDKYDNKDGKITNFCLLKHITIHEEYLKNKRIEFIKRDSEWNASINPFLLIKETKEYLNSINFTLSNEGLSEGERIAKYLSVGTIVALLNGWLHDDEISAKNHSGNQIRKVFKSQGKTLMYLSIDIRHGEFELIDEEGEHQAVYSFYGEKLNKEVDKATHKLTV